MDVSVSRSRVRGTARAPPSKSYTHRAILAAGYGSGATLVTDALDSADTRATARAVSAFGGDAEWTGDDCRVEGFGGRPAVPGDVLDCANSGTTMRLTTATAALADGLTVLTGDGSLRSRPQGPLLDAIEQLGGRGESTRANGCAPLVVGGPIAGGRASIPGDVSSQFVTALLMAGAVTDEGIEIELTTELKSAPYVDITVELLDAFGVDAGRTDGDGGGDGGGGVGGFRVAGGQRYATDEYAVPGDFSSLSYLLAAGALAGPDEREEFLVRGVRPSAQGDSAILDVLDRMGADLAWDRSAGEVRVARSSLSGIEYAVADTPDLLPTIAVLGAAADGTTRLTDCEHVRYKETDRVAAMAAELDRLGAVVEEREDELLVHGGDSELRGTRVDGHADHRIVMSLAVAGLVAEGTTTVSDAEDVDVSFPGFFDVLAELGADVRRE